MPNCTFRFADYKWSNLSTKVYCNARAIAYYRGLNGGTKSYLPFLKRKVVAIEFGPDVEKLSDYAFVDLDVNDIYCNSINPPVIDNSNVLKSVNKSKCTLHVPASALELYKEAYFWKDFYNIKSDVSGIDDITVEDNTPEEVYNLQGIKVAGSLEGISPGIYIVRRGHKTEKVIIR